MFRNEGQAKAGYILTMCVYGTIGFTLHFINIPSQVVVFVRAIIATLMVYLIIRLKGNRLNRVAIRKNLKWLVLSGFCLGMNWIFLFQAYLATTVAFASLTNYMAPVGMIILAPIVVKEKLNPKKVLCAALAVVGLVLASGILTGGAQGVNARGGALAFAAACGFGGMVLCNKKFKDIDDFNQIFVQLAVITLVVFPFAVQADLSTILHADVRSIILLLILSFVHTGLAYIVYFSALRHMKVQSIAVLGYIEPAVAVLCSALLLHEALSILGWLGAFLIIGNFAK